MSLRGYQQVPYPLGTPEWESFKNYAKAYYKEAIEIAIKTVVKEASPIPKGRWSSPPFTRIFELILDKTASPLVFLWEKWQLMGLDMRQPYATPEYKAEIERIRKETESVKKKAETITN